MDMMNELRAYNLDYIGGAYVVLSFVESTSYTECTGLRIIGVLQTPGYW